MTTISLLHRLGDDKLAARIRADLEAHGLTVVDAVQPGHEPLTIVILSEQSAQDAALQQQMIAALDNNQHIVPVLTQSISLPRLIDNLQPLDFSGGYDREALLARVDQLTAPDAPRPMVALTPRIQRENQRFAFIIVGVVVVMFILALIGVALGVFQAPADEFAGVETQIVLTRNYYIDQYIPRNTEEAENFPATLQDVIGGSTVQPYLILTATGIVQYGERTQYPRSTEQATAFALTVTRASTHVQERMRATVTALAATNAAVTPTPSNE